MDNGALADRAKLTAARKHNAVYPGPEIALCFVYGALEGADLTREAFRGKHLLFGAEFLPKQCVHFGFRPICRADFPAALLD